jgi:hypothetical protein
MSSASVARLTEGMSLVEIQKEMNKLGTFHIPPVQHHTVENGIEVIYVKKAGPQDRLRRLIMSDEMKTDEARPLANLILNACKKIGVDISDSRYQNVREALISDKGDFHSDMQDLVGKEAMRNF